MPDVTISPVFNEFVECVNSWPRYSGYYILKLISLHDSEKGYPHTDAYITKVMSLIDDKKWPCSGVLESWSDNCQAEDIAKSSTIDSLIGGESYGYIRPLMSRIDAERIWGLFVQQVQGEKNFYTGMGLGDPSYTFQDGCVIIGRDLACSLCIVDSD